MLLPRRTMQMEANLADFAEALGEAANATSYRAAAAARKEAVNTLLWNQTAGMPRRPCLQFSYRSICVQ